MASGIYPYPHRIRISRTEDVLEPDQPSLPRRSPLETSVECQVEDAAAVRNQSVPNRSSENASITESTASLHFSFEGRTLPEPLDGVSQELGPVIGAGHGPVLSPYLAIYMKVGCKNSCPRFLGRQKWYMRSALTSCVLNPMICGG